MEMCSGWGGRVTCAGTWHPSLKPLTQSRVFYLWSLREGQHLPLCPSIQHVWGQVRPPGPPFSAENPQKSSPGGNTVFLLQKLITRGSDVSLRGWHLEKAGTRGAAASLWIITCLPKSESRPNSMCQMGWEGIEGWKKSFSKCYKF